MDTQTKDGDRRQRTDGDKGLNIDTDTDAQTQSRTWASGHPCSWVNAIDRVLAQRCFMHARRSSHSFTLAYTCTRTYDPIDVKHNSSDMCSFCHFADAQAAPANAGHIHRHMHVLRRRTHVRSCLSELQVERCGFCAGISLCTRPLIRTGKIAHLKMHRNAPSELQQCTSTHMHKSWCRRRLRPMDRRTF